MRCRSPFSLPRGLWALAVPLATSALFLSAGPQCLYGSELRRTATVKVVQQARESIVNIHGQKTLAPTDEGYRASDTPQRVNGMGTGVVIDERGYIITNHHVIEGVRKIQVTLANEQSYTATLVSRDPTTDLAIIKISAGEKLPVINIGVSSDLMPGEPVIAVGNAYGYEHTVTRGIVSALHRTVQVSDTQSYRDLIQTDASINPGNSGGPLLNIDGEMIGINVAVRAGAQGIGFAIPVDAAMAVAADLLSAERVEKTWHGVAVQPHAEGNEIVLGELDEESPAAKSGLKAGDVVKKVGSLAVARPLDIERAILGHKPGEDVEVSVVRNQKPVTLSLTLASLPQSRGTSDDRAWDMLGLRLDPVPAERFRQTKTKVYRGGLLVTAVRPDSPAARESIQRGDILVGMHIWETVSLDNVTYILNRPDFSKIEPLKFYILRGKPEDPNRYETFWGHLPVSMHR
jgi:serine protease Do